MIFIQLATCSRTLSFVRFMAEMDVFTFIGVLSDSSDLTKAEIEVKIIENGGTCVQNPLSSTSLVVAGNDS